MPSPFPGMDPYLEAPDIWPDLHQALAVEISKDLNRDLPNPYYARLGSRPETGIGEEGGVAIEPIRHRFVEVRDSMNWHRLVALIEILSPSNKRPGPDREAYREKQRDLLDSDASLIEVDLLRSGDRVLSNPYLAAQVHQIDPRPDYLVLVNRPWQRAEYHVFPFGLREWLPCIPVPLKQGEAEVPLDLQYVFQRAYDGGPYRRGAVDYRQPPDPPLSGDDADWAAALLRDEAPPA